MNCLSIARFSQMIQAISIDSLLKKAINEAEGQYLIKPLGLQTLNPASVVQLLNRNFDKTQALRASLVEGGERINQTIWVLNEFKLFVWVSVCYAFTEGREFHKFTQEDYQFLQSLFTRKSTTFLEYHLKSLLKTNKKLREKWSEEEVHLLTKVIREEGFTYKWSEISYKLFEQSRKRFFRTPQKCREKWFNHLDPVVNRDKWTLEEDFQLFSSVMKFGSKWALISKLFNSSRTEHMIKNRYHSLMKKYQAKVNRLSTKKLIEKIQDDLFNRMHGIENPEEFTSIVKIEDQCESSGQEMEDVELQPKSSIFSETDEENEQAMKQMDKLRFFDLEQVLFSETTVEIQEPTRTLGEVELIEVEMFADMPGTDEYLNLLQ